MGYLFNQLTGNLIGFVVGMSATGLVSQFFETRSIKNLWGLAARKTVIDKSTFSGLEWAISVLIGFIVFEIVTKVLGTWIRRNYPYYKFKFLRWIVVNEVHHHSRTWYAKVNHGSIVLMTVVNQNLLKKSRK